jgi:hypothetical protein
MSRPSLKREEGAADRGGLRKPPCAHVTQEQPRFQDWSPTSKHFNPLLSMWIICPHNFESALNKCPCPSPSQPTVFRIHKQCSAPFVRVPCPTSQNSRPRFARALSLVRPMPVHPIGFARSLRPVPPRPSARLPDRPRAHRAASRAGLVADVAEKAQRLHTLQQNDSLIPRFCARPPASSSGPSDPSGKDSSATRDGSRLPEPQQTKPGGCRPGRSAALKVFHSRPNLFLGGVAGPLLAGHWAMSAPASVGLIRLLSAQWGEGGERRREQRRDGQCWACACAPQAHQGKAPSPSRGSWGTCPERRSLSCIRDSAVGIVLASP